METRQDRDHHDLMQLTEEQIIDNRYRLVARLGSGGMADVWLAEDQDLGRRVALKILHERFARDEAFVERFRREASSAAGLQHPNVVGVFDRGEVDGSHYIAMEYVEGSTLRELIHRGLEIGDAIEITRQLLSGVEFAHQHGIIHRDLKPANVLVDGTGRVRVADFGIARGTAGSEITETGSVMGTAEYFSPEQAQGRPVTAQSDLYSVGVILYEMLTGTAPFTGENTVAVAMKHVTERPTPPSTINPAVPRALDNVVLTALAKEPINRFTDAAEFRRSIDSAEADPIGAGAATAAHAPVAPTAVAPTTPLPVDDLPPPEDERRRKLLWIGLVTLLLGIIAAAIAVALFSGKQVRVPAVINLSENAATRELEQAGFEVDALGVASSAAPGTVVESDPPAGTQADEGSTVVISVSQGPGTAVVPDVSGLREQQAERTLEREGFEVRIKPEFSSDVKSGRAIGTRPSGGTRAPLDERVTLLISQGTEVVEVPDVVGKPEGIARQELEDAGFIVNSDRIESDAPRGEVVEQSPEGGTERATDSKVTILVSSGSSDEEVPDVVGDKRERAVERLIDAGFDVQTFDEPTTDPREDERVIRQSPAGGSEAEKGSMITLVIAVFEVEPEPEGEGAGGETDPDSPRPPARPR